MILIAVCGVITGFAGVVKNIMEIVEDGNLCPHTYYYHVMVIINLCVLQVCNQLVLWDIVYITFLRVTIILDVRHGIKTIKSKTALQFCMAVVFMNSEFNHALRIYFQDIELENGEIQAILNSSKCNSEGYKLVSKAENCTRRVFLTIASFTSWVVPIFILSFFSGFLIHELRTSPNPSLTSNQSTRRNKRASSSVLVFLVFYVLAELPLLILYSIGLYNPADFEQLDEYIYTQVDLFIHINMCLGILVYCLMSSQYRDTIRDTFCKKRTTFHVSDITVRNSRDRNVMLSVIT